VPEAVVPDNLKAAVIRAAFGVDRDDTGLNRTYREVARHYGFVVDPAPPRSPEKKGKVEAGVGYVKSNFWRPRAFEDLEQARVELQRWVDGIADQRVHGTTHRKPIELFEEAERHALKALPARPYVPVTWKHARVHPNSHVLFERREYSVPWTRIGQLVWIRATPTSVCIYADDERVATHDHRTGLGPPITVESHLPEHRRDLRHRSRGFWLQRARLVGEAAEQLVIEVFGTEDGLSRLRVVQAIVTHLEKFPKDRANAACERARFYGNHTYAGVRDILRKALDLEPLPTPLFPDPARPRPRFSRAPVGEA
jgi:transposase